MRTIFLIVSLFLLAAPVFAGHKKGASGRVVECITMHRTSCFGRCPDYKIEIFKNGLVRYTGYMFVTDSGTYTKKFSSDKAAALYRLFKLYRVDTCKASYENRIPDLPGLIYTIKYAAETQQINNAAFGPQYLKKLARSVDSLGQVDETWKKVLGSPAK